MTAKKEAIPIVRKAVKDGYDVVIAMSGDGTLGAVIRGVARSKWVIAPEPGTGSEKPLEQAIMELPAPVSAIAQ